MLLTADKVIRDSHLLITGIAIRRFKLRYYYGKKYPADDEVEIEARSC